MFPCRVPKKHFTGNKRLRMLNLGYKAYATTESSQHCFLGAQTQKHFFAETKCFWKKSGTFFVSRKQKMFPQQMFFSRTLRRGNIWRNMFPQLCFRNNVSSFAGAFMEPHNDTRYDAFRQRIKNILFLSQVTKWRKDWPCSSRVRGHTVLGWFNRCTTGTTSYQITGTAGYDKLWAHFWNDQSRWYPWRRYQIFKSIRYEYNIYRYLAFLRYWCQYYDVTLNSDVVTLSLKVESRFEGVEK